ncbi:unnamed protein product [Danaus chrysippus]|uniref:(African queen) hypothetical protein n=1 Tax=Danaus chrysippus TaxID=151541 RepID=A0A8J2QMG5_9NEOP|nr:unnamed protein product [Danaus chrysippus]
MRDHSHHPSSLRPPPSAAGSCKKNLTTLDRRLITSNQTKPHNHQDPSVLKPLRLCGRSCGRQDRRRDSSELANHRRKRSERNETAQVEHGRQDLEPEQTRAGDQEPHRLYRPQRQKVSITKCIN